MRAEQWSVPAARLQELLPGVVLAEISVVSPERQWAASRATS